MLEIIDHGQVREIRLARPPANALNPELIANLGPALQEAASAAAAVVVSGRPKLFSGGLDVPELIELDRDQMLSFWLGYLGVLRAIATMPVPIVFALTGHAPAGGIVMGVFSDYRIMPRGPYKTGFNEVQVGLVVPPQVHRALVRLIGAHAAERITVAGEMMDAQRALEIGLVDELVDEPEQVVPRAIEWCDQLLALPRPAMMMTRSMARADIEPMFEDVGDVEQFIGIWFQDSTQQTLRALVDRLRNK